MILYWTISELRRLFPPRNLVPNTIDVSSGAFLLSYGLDVLYFDVME